MEQNDFFWKKFEVYENVGVKVKTMRRIIFFFLCGYKYFMTSIMKKIVGAKNAGSFCN